jgi:hypothetical protein
MDRDQRLRILAMIEESKEARSARDTAKVRDHMAQDADAVLGDYIHLRSAHPDLTPRKCWKDAYATVRSFRRLARLGSGMIPHFG